VIDVLGKLVAQLGSDFVIALPNAAIRSGEAFQVRDRFDVPNNNALLHSHQSTPKKVYVCVNPGPIRTAIPLEFIEGIVSGHCGAESCFEGADQLPRPCSLKTFFNGSVHRTR
jgi:hypothetical protein